MMLENIRLIVKEKISLESQNKDANSEKIKILKEIDNFLKNDKCFLQIDINLAMDILVFIGYPKEEAKKIYIKIIKESSKCLKGKYLLTERI